MRYRLSADGTEKVVVLDHKVSVGELVTIKGEDPTKFWRVEEEVK